MALLLYGRCFGVGLVGDDFTLLDAALRFPLGELLTGRHGILGYYRPVSRELYFWAWGHLAGLAPLLYHAVNALTFAGAVLALHAVVEPRQGWRTALLAAAVLVLFPPTGALLAWISCAQDVIALFWAAAALALYAAGRRWASGLAVLLAGLSKETALVVAPAIAVYELRLGAPAVLRARVARLLPVGIGLVAAIAVSIAARASWPAGTAVSIWSPEQALGAWRLPGDFLASWVPPSTADGIGEAARTAPWALAALVLLAVLVVAPRGADPPRPGGGALVGFGLALLVLGILPVAVIVERWRSYFFSLAALGASLALGVGLARAPAWAARAALVVAVLVSFGSNTVYRALPGAPGPGRHAHVNYAFFRDNAALTSEMLLPLGVWCDTLRRVPRVYALDVPQNALFENLLGPGLRLLCRDRVERVRWLDGYEPADSTLGFGLMRWDSLASEFTFEAGDATARARLGAALLQANRIPEAIACLAAAVRERPADPSLHAALANARLTALAVERLRASFGPPPGVSRP